MSGTTHTIAAVLLSARWTPSAEPGVILAELGPERGAVGLAAIDPHRALDLSDADAAALAGHVANAHNMAICATPIVGFTPLPPEQLEQLKAMAATPGIIQAIDDHGLQTEVLRNILNAARALPSLKGITLTSQDPMAQARWLTALGDLQNAVAAYDAAPVPAPQTVDELAADTAASLFDGTILTESRLTEAIAAAIRQHAEAGRPIYPEELTPALLDALGTMNFQTGPIAHALRAAGADIPRKCEAEQAHVLHWFIRLVLQHGDGWRDAVGDELQRIADAARQCAGEGSANG